MRRQNCSIDRQGTWCMMTHQRWMNIRTCMVYTEHPRGSSTFQQRKEYTFPLHYLFDLQGTLHTSHHFGVNNLAHTAYTLHQTQTFGSLDKVCTHLRVRSSIRLGTLYTSRPQTLKNNLHYTQHTNLHLRKCSWLYISHRRRRPVTNNPPDMQHTNLLQMMKTQRHRFHMNFLQVRFAREDMAYTTLQFHLKFGCLRMQRNWNLLPSLWSILQDTERTHPRPLM